MTIKHLVISGGGPLGLRYLGALEKLEKENFWKVDNIESIYGTSVGSMIGAFICLKYDWETLNKYIIERPWKDVFSISGENMLNIFYKKGIFDQKFIEIIFKPFLEALDLSINITLKEFYDYCKIDFYLYTFELNKYETEELNYKTHPDLSLLKAVTMSCSLPYIFSPICFNNKCYIDGALMAQYPLNYCLKNVSNKEEILGINVDNISTDTTVIDETSSIIDYFSKMIIKTINFIIETNINNIDNIQNEIKCKTCPSMYSLEVINEVIQKQEMRKEFIMEGYAEAKDFLDNSIKKSLHS